MIYFILFYYSSITIIIIILLVGKLMTSSIYKGSKGNGSTTEYKFHLYISLYINYNLSIVKLTQLVNELTFEL